MDTRHKIQKHDQAGPIQLDMLRMYFADLLKSDQGDNLRNCPFLLTCLLHNPSTR